MGEMSREQRIETIARVCHEANRAWCDAHGDESQIGWLDAPEWQRESCRNGVEFAATGAGPEQLHENWLAVKEADGWVFGPVKDADAKVHPCMVAYADLPASQRTKDDLFRAVCDALIPVLLVGRFA